jgi:hypothetical protein
MDPDDRGALLIEHSYSFSSFSSISPLAFKSLRRLTSHYKSVSSTFPPVKEDQSEEEEEGRERTLCTLAKLTSITVDCSLNHSKSSIVSSKFLFAATSFPLRSVIASSRGYINIVFA